MHGVGLSIGSEQSIDPVHLSRVKELCDWLNPAQFSEHVAWSTHEVGFLNDLLPLPYDAATLNRVVAHIDLVRTTLGRQMLLENPSSYLGFQHSTYDECEYLSEIANRTGCGLLLDVNNVFVQIFPHAMENVGYDPSALGLWHWAVVTAGTWTEFILPLTMLIGLFTRLSALGMIGFIIVQSLTDLYSHGLAGDAKFIGGWFDRAPDAMLMDQHLL